MNEQRNNIEFIDPAMQSVNDAVALVHHRITDGTELPKLSRATHEALLVGITRNLAHCGQLESHELKARFASLRGAPEFSAENLKSAITVKAKQISRLERAVSIFSQ